MRIFVGAGESSSRIGRILFGASALFVMTACNSRNPDALSSPNTQQGDPNVDLNDAMNAIAAAPANSVDTAASASAPQPSATAKQASTLGAPTTKASPAARRAPQAEVNSTVVPPDTDEEDASDVPPEQPTNSFPADASQLNQH